MAKYLHFIYVIEFGSPLADVTCIDPYVSVLTEDGQAGIYIFKDGKLTMTKTRIGLSY